MLLLWEALERGRLDKLVYKKKKKKEKAANISGTTSLVCEMGGSCAALPVETWLCVAAAAAAAAILTLAS